ncbi:MAG: winged helix-turn-helix transcriptional regulator, partial [Solobacterium sp.]|nr:winged helix-turn-helix transcriptional regulator [Solobacterium sp.]
YYYGVLWNKLYRKEIIDRYAVKMDEELSFCEDFVFNLEYLLHTKSIMPLAIPIYYYVKTEGSLVAKNMNLPHIVKMKTSIYEYYDQFFMKILSEEEYSAERMNIARFFISAANDDMNIALLPSTKKLGEEKVQAYYHEEGKPTLLELSYYLRKYMERYLNDVALLHNLDRKDIWVFYTIYRTNALHSIKEIEDFTSLSHTAVMLSLQKLFASGYIKLQLDQIPIDITITSRADKIIKDIEKACHEAEEECLKGFEQKDKLAEELNEFYKKLKDSLPKEEI